MVSRKSTKSAAVTTDAPITPVIVDVPHVPVRTEIPAIPVSSTSSHKDDSMDWIMKFNAKGGGIGEAPKYQYSLSNTKPEHGIFTIDGELKKNGIYNASTGKVEAQPIVLAHKKEVVNMSLKMNDENLKEFLRRTAQYYSDNLTEEEPELKTDSSSDTKVLPYKTNKDATAHFVDVKVLLPLENEKPNKKHTSIVMLENGKSKTLGRNEFVELMNSAPAFNVKVIARFDQFHVSNEGNWKFVGYITDLLIIDSINNTPKQINDFVKEIPRDFTLFKYLPSYPYQNGLFVGTKLVGPIVEIPKCYMTFGFEQGSFKDKPTNKVVASINIDDPEMQYFNVMTDLTNATKKEGLENAKARIINDIATDEKNFPKSNIKLNKDKTDKLNRLKNFDIQGGICRAEYNEKYNSTTVDLIAGRSDGSSFDCLSRIPTFLENGEIFDIKKLIRPAGEKTKLDIKYRFTIYVSIDITFNSGGKVSFEKRLRQLVVHLPKENTSSGIRENALLKSMGLDYVDEENVDDVDVEHDVEEAEYDE